MKHRILATLLFAAFIALFAAGCTEPAPLETPDTAASLSPASQVPTKPAPSQTASPSPTPSPPLPCSIAFDSDRDGNREIYVMGPDGENPRNLSNHPAEDWDPAWSPDGKQIAFVSNRIINDMEGHFIYVMAADGSAFRQLTHDNGGDHPDWSHDGQTITYTADEDIFVIAADGSGQSINLTNSPEKDAMPVWSPDDSRIAWLSDGDGGWNIFVMDADGENVKQITHNGSVNVVAWTVDGRLFTHMDNPEAGCSNCVMDADGSNAMNAGGKGEIQRYLPFWTGNGERVECLELDMEGNADIFQIGEIFPEMFNNLTKHPAADRNPDWPAACGDRSNQELAETGQSVGADEIVIGYAGEENSQPQRWDNFRKACEELGVRCVNGDIQELIAQGADAIIQNTGSTFIEELIPGIQEASAKGIPVFILDAEVDIDGVYSVTIDHHSWARTSLEWMFAKIGGEGDIAYFDLHPVNRYSDSIEDLLADYPGISVVEKRDGSYDPWKIKPETVDFEKLHPGLKAVWTSFNMTEALRGLDESGLPREGWPLVNCEATMDGLETWMRMRQANPTYECIALANPPGVAYNAVYAAYYMLSGLTINQSSLGGAYGNSLYVDSPVISSDNLGEWLEKARRYHMNVMDQTMTPDEIKTRWFAN